MRSPDSVTEQHQPDHVDTPRGDALVESRNFRRWVGGCVGQAHSTEDKRFVGGCAGWIYDF